MKTALQNAINQSNRRRANAAPTKQTTLLISKLTDFTGLIGQMEKGMHNFMTPEELESEKWIFNFRNYTYKATVDGNLAGFIMLGGEHPKTKDGMLYIPFVFVLPKYRRNKIATHLFQYASDAAKQYGFNAIFYESDHTSPESPHFCEAMMRMAKENGGSVIDIRDKQSNHCIKRVLIMDNSIIIVVTEILHIKEPTRAELVERLSKHPPESKKALDLTRRIERLDLTNWKLKHLKKD